MARSRPTTTDTPETELTDAELRLKAATLEVALEKTEAAHRAKPTPLTEAAWFAAQAELRAARVFWRGIREYLAAAPATSKES